MAPVDHPEVDAALEQVADQRAVLLQVGHGVAADQPVDDQHRSGLDLDAGQRVVVVQRHLLDAHSLGLRRGADIDVDIADAPKRLGAAGEAGTELNGLAPGLIGAECLLGHGVAPQDLRAAARRRVGVAAGVLGLYGFGRRRRSLGSGIRGGEARVQRAHLATQLVDGAVQVVDLGAGRDRMGLAPDLDQLAFLQPVGDAGGEKLALRLQELVGALGADQLVVGDSEPAVEHGPKALLQQPRILRGFLGEGLERPAPGAGSHAAIGGACLAQRQPLARRLQQLALDRADVGELGSLYEPLDRLVDLIGAREQETGGVEHAPQRLFGDAVSFPRAGIGRQPARRRLDPIRGLALAELPVLLSAGHRVRHRRRAERWQR